jgi:hypothetical protein
MKKLKEIIMFILSMVIMAVSVLLLTTLSVVSMAFNSLLFILMVAGLSLPMFGNMLVGMLPRKATRNP